jgi:glycosyltransferase involved in cell wall biosynthesis
VPYLFPKAGALRERVVRSLARRSAGSIATNAADLLRLQTWTDRPVRHIPIGSNIDAYEPNHIEIAEVRNHLNLRDSDFLLGYFGFLNDSKGAETLIEAISLLETGTHLVFIGGRTGASDAENNQEYLNRLQMKIEQMGLSGRVHWTGFLPPKRVSTHLSAADLMVMPYRDGVSSRRGTLMAVLAHGRPLVTTTPDDLDPGFVHGESMWLVPPGDAKAVAEAVIRLRNDPDQRARLGQGAKKLAKSYSWNAIARQTAEFYVELVASSADELPR